MDSLTLTIAETAALLRIHPNTAYALAKQNRIPTIRLGRRVLVPKKRLEDFMATNCEPTKN